jgi:hypothetical protein
MKISEFVSLLDEIEVHDLRHRHVHDSEILKSLTAEPDGPCIGKTTTLGSTFTGEIIPSAYLMDGGTRRDIRIHFKENEPGDSTFQRLIKRNQFGNIG